MPYYIAHEKVAQPLLDKHPKAAKYTWTNGEVVRLIGDMPQWSGEVIDMTVVDLPQDELLVFVEKFMTDTNNEKLLIADEAPLRWLQQNHVAFKQPGGEDEKATS